MIQDLHSHTYYSFCGKDQPEAVIEAAIKGGIELLAITDHNYGVGFARIDAFRAPEAAVTTEYPEGILRRYFDHICLLKEKYARKITLLCGLEITVDPALPRQNLPKDADISFFDFCLLENAQTLVAVSPEELFRFGNRCASVGLAHTDLFSLIAERGWDALQFCRELAKRGFFWELNVNYDSIHGYREHAYVKEFFQNEAQQDIVRKSGLRLSVGFDGHRVEDYCPGRVADCCRRLAQWGFTLAFQE